MIATLVGYLVITHLRRRTTRVLTGLGAAAWAVAMGLSRVFLGHHWLTDVVFAWLIGLAWAAVLITGHRLLLAVRTRARGPETGAPRPGRPG